MKPLFCTLQLVAAVRDLFTGFSLTIGAQRRMLFPNASTEKYESLATFTTTDVTESNDIAMFSYYCAEEIREKVMMMRGYTDRDWAALKKELFDVFRYSDSWPDSLVYTRRYLEQFCAKVGGRDDMESLKSFLRTYDHISRIVTQSRMMCEYERIEILLHALSKRLWRKAISKLSMLPLEPSTFDYDKLQYWISAKISAAEALAMFEFLAPAAALLTTSTAPTSPPTSPALTTSLALPSSTSNPSSTSSTSMTPTTLTAPMALTTPTPTGITFPTNLAVTMAPTVERTAALSPPPSAAPMAPAALMAPTASTNSMAPMAFMTPAITMAPMASQAPTTTQTLSDSTAPIAPMAPLAVITSPTPMTSMACTPPARTQMARQGTIHTEPTVRLGIIRVESRQGQKICRHHYVQPEPVRPHRSDSTVTSQSEPAPSNRQMPVQPPQKPEPAPPEPVQPYRQEPAPLNCQEFIQPPPC
ncbi:hypothetical protein K440DRAFT_635704 [Wilcoxina mikolae CBS 423.85]|nr:hypothetical protein K440DRAFT_635704 [Wilcoxina mikolae CBS 423.85]